MYIFDLADISNTFSDSFIYDLLLTRTLSI